MKTTSFISLKSNLISVFNTPNKIVATWLFVLCGMIFFMVILGGLTRLTHSGLSMVDWRPITGWLPPMNLSEWQTVFDSYKSTPEYKKINEGMSLEGFKTIFWLEYAHRLWGRIMGIIFILPLVFFLIKGWIGQGLFLRLTLIFVMGAFQGLLGWYMVKSGLIDRPDVSQYRLVAHLSAAIIIYSYMFWLAMSLLKAGRNIEEHSSPKLLIATIMSALWVFLTIVSGGFVAGIDAGLTYNTFPMMDGDFVPEGLLAQDPWFINFFENVTTVQFNHRILAETTFIFIVGIWWASRKSIASPSLRAPFNLMFIMVFLQVALGIITLVLALPIYVASLHQIGALVLLTLSLWAVHVLKGSSGCK